MLKGKKLSIKWSYLYGNKIPTDNLTFPNEADENFKNVHKILQKPLQKVISGVSFAVLTRESYPPSYCMGNFFLGDVKVKGGYKS